MNRLRETLRKQDTDPRLAELLVRGLEQWHSQRAFRPSVEYNSLRNAISHQSRIGWFGLLTGHVSKYWRQRQRVYFCQHDPEKCDLRWATAVQKHLFQIAWDMWSDRNNIKHNSTTSAVQHEHARLDEQIREELEQGTDGIPRADRYPWKITIQTAMKWDRRTKKRWIRLTENIRTAHAKSVLEIQQSPEAQLLRRWLIS